MQINFVTTHFLITLSRIPKNSYAGVYQIKNDYQNHRLVYYTKLSSYKPKKPFQNSVTISRILQGPPHQMNAIKRRMCIKIEQLVLGAAVAQPPRPIDSIYLVQVAINSRVKFQPTYQEEVCHTFAPPLTANTSVHLTWPIPIPTRGIQSPPKGRCEGPLDSSPAEHAANARLPYKAGKERRRREQMIVISRVTPQRDISGETSRAREPWSSLMYPRIRGSVPW